VEKVKTQQRTYLLVVAMENDPNYPKVMDLPDGEDSTRTTRNILILLRGVSIVVLRMTNPSIGPRFLLPLEEVDWNNIMMVIIIIIASRLEDW